MLKQNNFRRFIAAAVLLIAGVTILLLQRSAAPAPIIKVSAQLAEVYQHARQTWPKVFGKTGTYSTRAFNPSYTILDDLSNDGHTIFISVYNRTPGFLQKMAANHLTYISNNLWSILSAACESTYDTSPCLIDQNSALQTSVLTEITAFLNRDDVKADPYVVGFWILDDYPGDVHHTLELIKRAIVEAPAPFPRATLCGFGGRALSSRATLTDQFSDNFSAFDRIIVNFSPKACDIVMYYQYARFENGNSDPNLTDWKMETLLPHLLTKTKEVGLSNDPGWNANNLIWGALADSFGNTSAEVTRGYLRPRYQDMLVQAESYCKAGATILLFSTWNDSQGNSWWEISNDPELRRGAKDGAALCRRYWNSPGVTGGGG